MILVGVEEYFEKMAGVLNTKGKLAKTVSEERAKERTMEEKITYLLSLLNNPQDSFRSIHLTTF